MKMKIAQNIRALRKQHSFTQEQLSEVLGVTASAVYKWESGQTVPEVKMLMELADLFEISVDTLLGYDRQNENVDNRLKRIDQCMKERDFEQAALEVEKVLKRYPNKFDVVHVAATAYHSIYMEKRDEKAMQRSIDLFYRAIPLLYQNKYSTITEATLLGTVGSLYIEAGQKEKGLEILKKNNTCSVYSGFIGLTLAKEEKCEEAKEYLKYAYFFLISDTLDVMFGLMYLYAGQKNELYKEVGKWILNYLDSLVFDREEVTFIDKDKAMILAEMSVLAATFGNYKESEQYIKDAYLLAMKFDAQPDYTVQVMKLWQDWADVEAWFYPEGQDKTAISAIENDVLGKAKQGAALDFVKKKFEDLLCGEGKSNEKR